MKIYKILSSGILFSTLALFFLASSVVVAQDTDPPGRVARMNYTQGSVSFQPGGEGDWVEAVPNRPLTTGDNLWADQNSRAELHVGSTAIRLSSETSVTFLDLDDHTTQLKLSQGSIIIRLRHIDDGDLFEVDTPNLAFTLQTTGEYRIDVNGAGDQTDVSVFSGRGQVTGGGYTYSVVGGQDDRFTGTDQLNYDIGQLPGQDDFAQWAVERDHREDGPESANYVSPEMTGYEDLDDYGQWRYVAGYGTVWLPAGVASDWAPYRHGHWVWVEPWGWTWVEDEPWGFAPFHYGRWAYAGGGWCWVPGPVVVRPVYAPALVAFVGGGGVSLSISVGGGGIGWFPLAPGEVYVPPYRVSRGYVNNVNITNTRVNVTQITNVYNIYNSKTTNVTHITYVNQRVNNGVTVVTHDTFVNARPVSRNLVRVDDRQITEANATHKPWVEPSRQSVMGAGGPARVRPPEAIVNRRVIATRNPTPPREPFEQRQPKENVRTETPNPRPEEARNTPRPPQMESHPETPKGDERPQPQPQPQLQSHPETPKAEQQPPRLESHPEEPSRPEDNSRNMTPRPPENSSIPREQTHPLVRPAPPVREKTPDQQQREAQKFRTWQEGRQKAQNDRPEKRDKPAPERHDPK